MLEYHFLIPLTAGKHPLLWALNFLLVIWWWISLKAFGSCWPDSHHQEKMQGDDLKWILNNSFVLKADLGKVPGLKGWEEYEQHTYLITKYHLGLLQEPLHFFKYDQLSIKKCMKCHKSLIFFISLFCFCFLMNYTTESKLTWNIYLLYKPHTHSTLS